MQNQNHKTEAILLYFINNQTAVEIDNELQKAKSKHPGNFTATHQGYAVLLEEVDELWADIKADAPKAQMRKEAIQVAAMAIRIIQELCSEEERMNTFSTSERCPVPPIGLLEGTLKGQAQEELKDLLFPLLTSPRLENTRISLDGIDKNLPLHKLQAIIFEQLFQNNIKEFETKKVSDFINKVHDFKTYSDNS